METRGRNRAGLELESGVDGDEDGHVRDASAAQQGEEGLREAGHGAEADSCPVPRQPSPGEQVLFCKLLRDGILKHFNPFKLSDLQCILELRCFKGVLSNDDLRYYFESFWSFREYTRLGCVPREVRETAVDAVKVLREVRMMQSHPELSLDWEAGCHLLRGACRGGLSTSVIRSLIKRLRGISRSDQSLTLNELFSIGVGEASKGGHVLLIDLLVQEYGADVNAKDKAQMTPLHYAFSHKSCTDVPRLLLEYGADVNAKQKKYGLTPLHVLALLENDIHVARLLLEHGADVNAKTEDGDTPLHVAAGYRSRVDFARLLLQHGADVNARNNHGETALLDAIGRSGRRQIIELLLEHGADVEAKDRTGQNALAKAAFCRFGSQEILNSHIKKQSSNP